MITTNEGVRIECQRLDEWIISMRMSKKSYEGAEVSLTAILTIQDLVSEVNLLQRSKPKSAEKGAEQNEHAKTTRPSRRHNNAGL